MLLTLTTTHRPATDLGYLLRKNPARAQSFNLSFGRAHVFYPEAGEERCTAALLVEVDPVGLVRNRRGPAGEGGLLDQYVNDRPYAASSFLSVAIADVFGTAMSGACKERPELAQHPIPLRVVLPAVPSRGGTDLLHRLWEPLGYEVHATRLPLDEQFPDWGESGFHRLELETTQPLHQVLSHLYVLIPVLDNDKHYWVGDEEVAKLMRHGEGWLSTHPERAAITRRYLKHQRGLVNDALAQLADDAGTDPDETAGLKGAEEAALESSVETLPQSIPATPPEGSPKEQEPTPEERAPSLNEQRLGSVLAVLKGSGATSVVDLGCGEGKLLRALLKERQFTRILGMDVSHHSLETAADRLHLDRMPPKQKARIGLLHGSLMYRDDRLAGF
ncbi:MAG: 3' terminal RNA ribose 2'-O-methyltransferase Hen1, partial [Verrucomicrobiae bacterium]|nr:3' terminal RNA ribose 2'-O-methyltransferase Hen1 [Verrucomicrobiae bacterium]